MPSLSDATELTAAGQLASPTGEESQCRAGTAPEHAASCFGLEEERGHHWNGAGSAKPVMKEIRPTL
jgi:hypothetical protein